MTDPDNLRELIARATPGSWYTLDPPWLPRDSETSILAGSPDPHVATFVADMDMWALDDDDDRKSKSPDADAALIVAAVNALPGLLDALASLQSENERLRAACVRMTEHYVRLANSGDAGFWNPEEEDVVKEARAAAMRA